VELTPDRERQLAQMTEIRREQQRLAQAARIFEGLAEGVGSAWGQALSSVADGTRTVAEAFREMGRSILQTMTQIASQEAFRAFMQLGLGLLTTALTGGVGSGMITGPSLGESPGAVGYGINPVVFGQEGAVIRKPTMLLAGENPMTSPEMLLNRQQLSSMTQPAASTVVHPPTVILVDDRAAAARAQMAEAAAGREAVIVNAVLNNLKRGESSSINRTLRTLQR
jgi:hypothetical protein